MTIELHADLVEIPEKRQSVYRWPVGFFFALVSIPFATVWLITQGPKTFDQLHPTYEVVSVGSISDNDLGLIVRNVVFKKHHSCEAEGVIYLSGTYQDGPATSEVLMHADQGAAYTPLPLKQSTRFGDDFTIPEMRIVVSKALLGRMDRFRFMIPCKMPYLGNISAYTNSFAIN